MTAAAGVGALSDKEYFEENCKRIIEAREYASSALRSLGFTMTDSMANFIFARHERIGGEKLYLALREKGVLVRHFGTERIKDYNRITVGSMSEMETLIDVIKEILEETP
jgi:histidinol-phosphate aminotransferase